MDILTALGALTTAIKATKLAGDAVIQAATADLALAAARAKSELAEQLQRNARLEAENRALTEQLALQQDMAFEENVCWRKLPDGSRDGPFCPRCLDGKGKAAHMGAQRGPYITDYYACTVCDYRADDPHGTPKKSLNQRPRQDY